MINNIKTKTKKYIRILQNIIKDIKYGGRFIGGTKKSKYEYLGAHDVANSDYDDLDKIFSGLEINEKDVLLDIGCGRGRVLNYWNRKYPKNYKIGIEIDEEIANEVAARLRKHNIKIIARDFRLENIEEADIIYIYNPFEKDVVQKLYEIIIKNKIKTKKSVKLIYHNAKFIEIFKHKTMKCIMNQNGKKSYVVEI